MGTAFVKMNTLVIFSALVVFAAALPRDLVGNAAKPSLEDNLARELELGTALEHLTERGSENGLTNTQRQDLLDAHNDARRQVSPTASNMEKMEWDSSLETIAQSYADTCVWQHNSQRSTGMSYYVGENLYLTTGGFSASGVVNSWNSEKSYYDYSTQGCSKVCGHYTQVVWSNSNKLGCGIKRCSQVTGLSGWSNVLLAVCNYGKGGNYRGVSPYLSGTQCSNCPSGTSCDNGLCSTGSSSSGLSNTSGNTSSGCK